MPVIEATDGVLIEANHVYVLPPHTVVTLNDGRLDIRSPQSDHELAEPIRREAWGNTITLIAVTGWRQESDRRRALLAGFDHHLTKPIDLEQLFDTRSIS